MDDASKSRFVEAAQRIAAAEMARLERAKQEAESKLRVAQAKRTYQEDLEDRVIPLFSRVSGEATAQMGADIARVAVASRQAQLPRIGEFDLQLFLLGSERAVASMTIVATGIGHLKARQSTSRYGSEPVPLADVNEQVATEVIAAFVEAHLPK